jgi:UrcA family protein
MLKQLVISSLVFVAAAPMAHAQSSDLPSVKVSLAGIDARSDTGAQIVLRRIKTAAGKVCGNAPSSSLDRLQKFEPCVREVTQRTVTELNTPTLTAAWNKETGVEPRTQVAERIR